MSIRQAQTSEGGPEAILSPLGGLRWTQKKAPLRTTLERFGGSPLTTTQRIELTVDRPTTATDDWFAPGSFVELTQSEALNRPSFERLTAGADIGFGGLTGDGNPITHEADVDVIKLPEPEPISLAFLVALPGIVVANASRRDAAAAAAHVAPIIGVSQETMSVVESSGATVHTGLSATEAHQRARHNGGVAVTDVDVVDLVGV